MGTWGTGLYSNDTAEDIKEMCKEIFPFVSVDEGNWIIFEEYKDLLEMDSVDNNYASFWYALSDWQWKHGMLRDDIRDKTIKLLESYAGIEEWEESGSKSDVKKRKAVMDKLLLKLKSPQPDLKKPKPDLEKPKHKKGDVVIIHTRKDCNLWKFERCGYGYYVYDNISNEACVLVKPFDARGKYVAVLCVGSEKELHSKHLPDVYDEYGVYAVYDYCEEEKPTIEILKKCGFLPTLLKHNRNEDEKSYELSWTYSTQIHSFYYKKYQDIYINRVLDECDRFENLLKKKNYCDESAVTIFIDGAIRRFYEEKIRLKDLNIEIDNLIDENVQNPELMPKIYREW